MLRLAVWFYQVRYHVRAFLSEAKSTADKERRAADHERWKAKYAYREEETC